MSMKLSMSSRIVQSDQRCLKKNLMHLKIPSTHAIDISNDSTFDKSMLTGIEKARP
jgi:hypothetical protein